ncbi:NfeD family protein [Desulfotalea psychrophila]|nr:NfeD family protein [Desulfocapsa sp.]MBN4048693.1 NfeD family protein [bacterium AH-315-N22]MBN4071601.1 NfeD family protein [Desulfotalea psychrophila]
MEITYPGLMWLAIGATFFVLEMAVPGFILFFFGLAAWLTALGCYFFPWSVNTQLAVFLVLSLVCLFSLRGIATKIFIGDKKDEGEDTILAHGGEKCVVTTAIKPPSEGQVKFAGTFWRAEASEEFVEGDVVEIVKQNNLLITVKKPS